MKAIQIATDASSLNSKDMFLLTNYYNKIVPITHDNYNQPNNNDQETQQQQTREKVIYIWVGKNVLSSLRDTVLESANAIATALVKVIFLSIYFYFVLYSIVCCFLIFGT